jgi:hypothetical protein
MSGCSLQPLRHSCGGGSVAPQDASATSCRIIEAKGPEGRLFAGVDPEARYTSPRVCTFKFSATLCPYPSEEDARAALAAAGATVIGGEA